MTVTVTVKCIGCGAKKEIGPGEIPEGEVPFCEKCFNPMIPVSAEAK